MDMALYGRCRGPCGVMRLQASHERRLRLHRLALTAKHAEEGRELRMEAEELRLEVDEKVAAPSCSCRRLRRVVLPARAMPGV